MSDALFISRWALIRRNELVDIPDKIGWTVALSGRKVIPMRGRMSGIFAENRPYTITH